MNSTRQPEPARQADRDLYLDWCAQTADGETPPLSFEQWKQARGGMTAPGPLEAAARALAGLWWDGEPDEFNVLPPREQYIEKHWPSYIEQARAALRAYLLAEVAKLEAGIGGPLPKVRLAALAYVRQRAAELAPAEQDDAAETRQKWTEQVTDDALDEILPSR